MLLYYVRLFQEVVYIPADRVEFE
jgi:hypothetical protein